MSRIHTRRTTLAALCGPVYRYALGLAGLDRVCGFDEDGPRGAFAYFNGGFVCFEGETLRSDVGAGGGAADDGGGLENEENWGGAIASELLNIVVRVRAEWME